MSQTPSTMHEPPSPNFPFAAVVGQPLLKRALLLATVDPRLGGVLIQGPRGVAKSTLARGLADLLPNPHSRFVELPLGATSDRLTGSLNLERVLKEQEVAFQPGLFAEADQGVLYIDEINLLEDSLVDLLLDVAAQGVNHVERDGLSHSHPARFVLIGTMNPDEGELRPQLSDRFGLSVELESTVGIDERMEIVNRRLAFDESPHPFCERYSPSTQQLQQTIKEAINRLDQVVMPQQWVREIAERSLKAGVEGVRCDIAWRRAAIANAALDNRMEVTLADINTVQPLVLGHRTSDGRLPPDGGNDEGSASQKEGDHSSNESSPPSSAQRGSSLLNQRSSLEHPTERSKQFDASSQRFGESSLTDKSLSSSRSDTQEEEGTSSGQSNRAITQVTPQGIMPFQRDRKKPRLAERKHKRMTGYTRNGHGHATSPSSSVDWFSTFTHRRNHTRRLHQQPLSKSGLRTLVRKLESKSPRRQTLVMWDLSASTLSKSAVHKTASAILMIAKAAKQQRHQFALLGFRNGETQWICRARRVTPSLEKQLRQLDVGGGTPLNKALEEGQKFLRQRQRQSSGIQCKSWLLTDGRSKDVIALEHWPELEVIDSEQGRVKLGRARALAEQLGAHYRSLENFLSPSPYPHSLKASS